MANRRADGTNPRSLGTNPRATAAQGEGAASPGHPPDGARQEVSTQIPSIQVENAAAEWKRRGMGSFDEWLAGEKNQGRDWLASEGSSAEMVAMSNRVAELRRTQANGSTIVVGPVELGEELRGVLRGVSEKKMDLETPENRTDSLRSAVREHEMRMGSAGSVGEALSDRLRDGVREAVVAATDAEVEQREAEARFMAQVESATRLNVHDDDCPERKGKECGCRENLVRLDKEELPWLEELEQAWDITVWGPKDPETKKPTSRVVHERAVLVRVDDGRKRTRRVPDPTSPHSRRFIEFDEFDPPRWICTSCAQSMRSNSAKDISHQCDDARKSKASKPMGLDRSLPPELKFGGAYRLVVWMDRSGSYHLGEELVVGNVVKEIRELAGPEPYHVIEGAILDAAVTRLAP